MKPISSDETPTPQGQWSWIEKAAGMIAAKGDNLAFWHGRVEFSAREIEKIIEGCYDEAKRVGLISSASSESTVTVRKEKEVQSPAVSGENKETETVSRAALIEALRHRELLRDKERLDYVLKLNVEVNDQMKGNHYLPETRGGIDAALEDKI